MMSITPRIGSTQGGGSVLITGRNIIHTTSAFGDPVQDLDNVWCRFGNLGRTAVVPAYSVNAESHV